MDANPAPGFPRQFVLSEHPGNMGQLESVQTQVLALDDDSPLGTMHAAVDAVAAMSEKMRHLKSMLDSALMIWIERNGQLTIGDKRWYVGPVTKSKCRDVKALCECILSMGSVEDLQRVLASDAFKPGETRKLFDEWGPQSADANARNGSFFLEYFDVKIEQDLQTGKPLKRVQVTNDAFAKGGK